MINEFISACLLTSRSVCQSACPPTCLFIFLSVCLSASLSIYLTASRSIYLTICLPTCVFIFMSVYQSVRPSVCSFLLITWIVFTCSTKSEYPHTYQHHNYYLLRWDTWLWFLKSWLQGYHSVVAWMLQEQLHGYYNKYNTDWNWQKKKKTAQRVLKMVS